MYVLVLYINSTFANAVLASRQPERVVNGQGNGWVRIEEFRRNVSAARGQCSNKQQRLDREAEPLAPIAGWAELARYR